MSLGCFGNKKVNPVGIPIKNGQDVWDPFTWIPSSKGGSDCKSWGLWKKEIIWELKEIISSISFCQTNGFNQGFDPI